MSVTDRFMAMFHLGLLVKSLRADPEPEPLTYVDRGEAVPPVVDTWTNTDVWAAKSRGAVGH